jgi:hypothetical protein
MHWDSLVLALLVGTAFAAVAVYQFKSGAIQMKNGKSYDRKDRPVVFWLWIAICVVAAASCYIDAYNMVSKNQ